VVVTAISEIMTSDPITIAPQDSVKAAFQLMEENKIRHLPVVSKGRLAGILSDRDIRPCLPPVEGERAELELALRLLDEPVRNHMTDAVKFLPPDAPVVAAVDLMLQHRIGCLPIVEPEAKKVLGVVTYFDLLMHLRPNADT
jgi:acetoin utilization protein AcuB